MTEYWANRAKSTLDGAIGAGATSLTIDTPATGQDFPASVPFRVICGTEIVLVTARAGNVFTITRGHEGTTAASHAGGAVISGGVTAGALTDLQTGIDGKQPLDSDLTAFAGKTAPSGAVVGTTDTQTLTNKTLTSPAISTPTGIVKGDVGLGNVDNTSNATERAATATLTNKTLTAPLQSSYEDFTEMAAPGTPASGTVRVYAKADGLLYSKDDAGAETLVSGGAGGGGGHSQATQTNWTAPTLLNSWVDFGSPFQGAEYMKDAQGFVHLRGLIKSGTATSGTILFTLPSGSRPPALEIFPVLSNGALGRVDIASNGDVSIFAGSNVYLDLAGIMFSVNATTNPSV